MRKILLVLAALAAGSIGFFFALLSPVQTKDPFTVSYGVLPGESVQEIADNLQSMGLIRGSRAFVLLVRLKGSGRSLKAGPYRAESSEWAWEILDRMVRGDFQDTTVTIPEGLWVEEIAQRVAPVVTGGADAFLAATHDTVLLRIFGIPGESAEGYLFPETYRLIPGTPAPAMVRQMVRTFDQNWKQGLEERATSGILSRHEVVTLASIVEAETRVGSERPRIAAVYLNRLARGIPLQADPTVVYGIGERRSRTLYADLEHASPYNTYRHEGLPPGPIGNPGRAALRAVLWPLEGCEDLFFVARGDGTHLFARDFEGHKINRRLARQFRRSAR